MVADTDYKKLAEDALNPKEHGAPGFGIVLTPTYDDLARALLACDRERQEDRKALGHAEDVITALREGTPYPDCVGDCGERGMYCCDGLWDERRKAEALAQRYRDALEEVWQVRQSDNPPGDLLREIWHIIRAALTAGDKE